MNELEFDLLIHVVDLVSDPIIIHKHLQFL